MSKPRVSARPLTEGAIFAAVAVVLALAGYYIPVLGLFTTFLWPVPIALIAVRHGMRTAVLTVITAGVVLSTFVGALEGAMTSVTLGLIGLAIGFGLRRKYSAPPILFLATVAVSVGAVIGFFVGLWVLKINIITDMLNQWALVTEQVSEMYRSMAERFGIPKENLEVVLKAFGPEALQYMKLILPGGAMVGFTIGAFLNYEACRIVLPRFGYQVPQFPIFENWKFPRVTGLLFILAQVMVALRTVPSVSLLGRTIQIAPYGELLYKLGANISYPAQLLVIVQGFAVAYFYLVNPLKLSRSLAKIIMWFALFNPMLSQIAFMFGLFDNVFDYRRWLAKISSNDGDKNK